MSYCFGSLGTTYRYHARNHLTSNISNLHSWKIIKQIVSWNFTNLGWKSDPLIETHAWFYSYTVSHLNNSSKNIIIHNIFQLGFVILLSWLSCARAFVKILNLRNALFFMMEIGVIWHSLSIKNFMNLWLTKTILGLDLMHPNLLENSVAVTGREIN